MCQRCNDVGYLSVSNGDDDQVCPECQGVTVAVEEPLSEVARIRLHLEALEEIECKVHPGSTDAEWLRFQAIQDKVYENITDDLRTLIDNLDERRNTVESLIAERDTLKITLGKLALSTEQLLSNHAKLVNHIFPGGLPPLPLPDEEYTFDLRIDVIDTLNEAIKVSGV